MRRNDARPSRVAPHMLDRCVHSRSRPTSGTWCDPGALADSVVDGKGGAGAEVEEDRRSRMTRHVSRSGNVSIPCSSKRRLRDAQAHLATTIRLFEEQGMETFPLRETWPGELGRRATVRAARGHRASLRAVADRAARAEATLRRGEKSRRSSAAIA